MLSEPKFHTVCYVQTGTKLTNLPGWYQCPVPSYNAANWDPLADMGEAACQSGQYSLVVCPASFSDLLAASQVVVCTAYNVWDSISEISGSTHTYSYMTAAYCGMQNICIILIFSPMHELALEDAKHTDSKTG